MENNIFNNHAELYEYAKKLYMLVKEDINLCKANIAAGESPESIAQQIPKLVSKVNMVGYFRGQDGGFFLLNEMTAYTGQDAVQIRDFEDELERELWGIITYTTSTENGLRSYKAYMAEYYLISRGISKEEISLRPSI